MDDRVTPPTLAPMLGWSAPTLRRAVLLAAQAEVNRREQPGPDRRTDEQREREAALLTVKATPGDYLRWSRANAARVLRAFGKPVPDEWASPAGQEPARGAS